MELKWGYIKTDWKHDNWKSGRLFYIKLISKSGIFLSHPKSIANKLDINLIDFMHFIRTNCDYEECSYWKLTLYNLKSAKMVIKFLEPHFIMKKLEENNV